MKRLAMVFLVLSFHIGALAQVATGIDVLEQEDFAPLRALVTRHGGHLRLGLMTNQSGLDSHERRTIDVLQNDATAKVPGLKLVTLFSPEHGINGVLDTTNIGNSIDQRSGLPVISLFGAKESDRRPSASQMAGVDAVIIDLQDAGVRYYTYETVVGYFLEASVASKTDVIILDRPNPIGGLAVQGPVTTKGRENYISYYAEPVRHGMTLGELAGFFNGENKLGASLQVIRLTGWNRTMMFDRTGLLWVNPSPNLRSLPQAIAYTGIGLLEHTNLSVGRGTDSPFLLFGAPWIHATELAAYLNGRHIAGVTFMPTSFTPGGEQKYPYHGERCEGIMLSLDRPAELDGPAMGVEVASALWKLYPQSFKVDGFDDLALNTEVVNEIRSGRDPRSISMEWTAALAAFSERRALYLLYR